MIPFFLSICNLSLWRCSRQSCNENIKRTKQESDFMEKGSRAENKNYKGVFLVIYKITRYLERQRKVGGAPNNTNLLNGEHCTRRRNDWSAQRK
jgi:hypothetical protein